MIEKTINHKTGSKTYQCYDKEEADELNIEYKYWKDCEPGEYGLTDDDMVVQLIKKKSYPDGRGHTNVYYTFPIGSIFYYEKYPDRRFDILNSRGTYDTGSVSRDERRIRGRRGEMIARFYAIVPNIDMAIDNVLGPHSDTTHGKWKRYSKTEVFKTMVREELQALLSEKGFSEGQTLDLLNDTIAMCKEKRDTSTLMRAISELLEIHGMKSKDKVKSTDAIEYKEKSLIDEINRSERSVRLERKVESDGQTESITETIR